MHFTENKKLSQGKITQKAPPNRVKTRLVLIIYLFSIHLSLTNFIITYS